MREEADKELTVSTADLFGVVSETCDDPGESRLGNVVVNLSALAPFVQEPAILQETEVP